MGLISYRSKRKVSGGRYRAAARKKRIFETRSLPRLTKIGKTARRVLKTIGGNTKRIMLSVDEVNLYDPKTKKHVKAKVNTVLETPANRHFQRRNIMTKGTLIDTDKGKAKITSRPGQEGTLNAVLV